MQRARAILRHLWPVCFYHIFLPYLVNGTIFGKIIESEMRVLIFSATLSETFIILRRIQPGTVMNVDRFHVKYSLFLSDFNKLQFFDRFSKNIQMLNFMKILPAGADLSYAAGRKEGRTKIHDEPSSRFSQYCESA
jgi:hypothetical protein